MSSLANDASIEAQKKMWNEGVVRSSGESDAQGWESRLIREVALSALQERRRARRWGIFFKLLTFTYLSFLLWHLAQPLQFLEATGESDRHTALVNLQGVISAWDEASAENVISSLQAAFADPGTAGIILQINSPGGSPVQAGTIYDEIVRLKEQHPQTPVYAVLGDVCASGGYYVAAAADKIYADQASIVGSIGVRMDGFGFTGLMEKLGIERRLLVSGDKKALLDPFLPADDSEKEHIQVLLDQIHQQFIERVKSGRKDRLINDPALFSGLVWTGQQGLENGLVDALGSAEYVAREIVGEESIVTYAPNKTILEEFSRELGVALGGSMQRWLTAEGRRSVAIY